VLDFRLNEVAVGEADGPAETRVEVLRFLVDDKRDDEATPRLEFVIVARRVSVVEEVDSAIQSLKLDPSSRHVLGSLGMLIHDLER
jgi:hypothetical protein